MQASGELPLCPVCCELLGNCGGPVTLPCGHNGCLQCFTSVQSRKPECPLCRAPFDPCQQLVCNHELRDLVALATSFYMDEKTKEEGWEAFPTAKLMNEHYAYEVKKEARDQPFRQLLGSPADASAPALGGSGGHNPSDSERDILLLDPPQWLPDSFASNCGACQLPFKPLLRLRHHCRMCGKIFCHPCCRKLLLLPPRFKEREPQRVCEMCSALLQPLQSYLVGALSASSQPPVYDALDSISLRSWFNSPWTAGLQEDIYKATNMIHTFIKAGRVDPERRLPATVLAGAKGLALLSVVKVGAGWSATLGTGLIIARQRSGSWSAPCAAACYGLGWGLQLGGGLTDLILVIRTEEVLRAFCSKAHLGVGGAAGVAVGPLGRSADASLRLGPGGGVPSPSSASVVGYSCSKGAFVGVSLEGSVTCVRDSVNLRFYGYPTTARQLLLDGGVPQPPAGAMLYDALESLMQKYENRSVLWTRPAAAASASSSAAAASAGRAAAAAGESASCSASCGSSSSQATAAAAQLPAAAGSGSSSGGGAGRWSVGSAPAWSRGITSAAAAALGGGSRSRGPSRAVEEDERVTSADQILGAAVFGASQQQQQRQHEEEEDEDSEPQYELEW